MKNINTEKNSWLTVVDDIGIEKGDVLYVSSELLMIMWLCKKEKSVFDANLLIEYLMSKVGKDGTLLIPTYNFDFSNHGIYDRARSKSTVGFLGNVALERNDFIRTRHPMHSFAVWGKYQNTLINMNNSNSFGDETPFAFMINVGAKEIGIGIDDCSKGCTFVHHVEVKANVPYRFIKVFHGKYIDFDGIDRLYECEYSARDLSIKYKTNSEGLWKIMTKNGSGNKWVKNGIPVYCVNMEKAYQNLYCEMTKNKMKNIMDFSIDREFLFSDKYEVCRI